VIWCIENPERSLAERAALGALENATDWLALGEWHLDNSACLVLDADVTAGGQVYPVSLRYPNHFPITPAMVLPRGAAERWSNHQYGVGGELCLEYGPDNWRPEITGADMLQSAYRLLSGERPAPAQTGEVASRHKTTLGQNLKDGYSRLVITQAFNDVLREMPEESLWTGSVACVVRSTAKAMSAKSVDRGDAGVWIVVDTPGKLLAEDGFARPLAIIRWPAGSMLPPSDKRSTFMAALKEKHPALADDVHCVLLIRGDLLNAFCVYEVDDLCAEASVIPVQPFAQRLDLAHLLMAERRVAMIGCGSVGSKIAVMLARSGVGKFLLVDDDLMLPENLVRNNLDWRDVGSHKVEALKRQILLVNPTADVTTRVYRLGGQASSGSIESVLERIAECDLLVDATADEHVFNYLAAAVGFGKKPMVWAEVFGGGIGGLIARHRPGLEPDPQTMRAQIEYWCHQKGKPIERAARSYETTGDDGAPLVADDADVSVIAAHASRLAIDTLIGRTPSAFPVSTYMIGMRSDWLFEAPFETYPIDVGAPGATTQIEADPELAKAEALRIVELMKKKANEAAATTEDPPASAA
jgi:ubiquitin-protein ligase